MEVSLLGRTEVSLIRHHWYQSKGHSAFPASCLPEVLWENCFTPLTRSINIMGQIFPWILLSDTVNRNLRGTTQMLPMEKAAEECSQ